MNFCEVSEKEFSDFAKKTSSNNFLQSIEMYDRYKARKNEAYLVGVKDGKKVLAVALIVTKYKKFGQKVFISPRGFLADFEAANFDEVLKCFTDGIRKFLKEKRAMLFEISPNFVRRAVVDEDGVPTENLRESEISNKFIGLGYKDLGEYEFVKWVYALPLDGINEDNFLAHLRADHRRTTRLTTERYGMRVRELDESELQILKDLSNESAERHNFKTPEISYYIEMKKAYGEKVRFMVAEVSEKVVKAFDEKKDSDEIKKIAEKVSDKDKWVPIAAAMFVIWPNEVVYLFSGSSAKYKKFGGPHLLQKEMILFAVKAGIPKYNFYGTDPKPKDGVYEFKRGYHGELQEYLGTFMLPISLLGKILLLREKYQDVRDIH